MTPILRPLALVLAPTVLVGGADQHAFAPEEGGRITVSFEQRFRVELVDATATRDGEEMDTSETLPEIVLDESDSLTFVDEFVAVGDTRPTRVLRTYESLEKESVQSFTAPDGTESEVERSGESELEGMTIAFDWSEDDEAYVASFTEEEGDPDLLDDLEFGGYLAQLLPEGAVEEGDSWDVDVLMFDAISEPCGDVDFVMEDEEEDDDDDWTEQFSDNLAGDFFVEYAGTRDEGGTTVAVYVLDAEVTTEVERDSRMEEGELTRETFSVFGFEFLMEGELLWDVEANRPYALTFSGDVEFEVEEESLFIHPQGELEATQVQYFEGTVEISASYD